MNNLHRDAKVAMSSSRNHSNSRGKSKDDYYAKCREIPCDSQRSNRGRGGGGDLPRHSQRSHSSGRDGRRRDRGKDRRSHRRSHSYDEHASPRGLPPPPSTPHKDVELAHTSSSQSDETTKSAKQALVDYENRWRLNITGCELDGLTQEEAERLLPALAWRSYHLPGNGCKADWIQYFANNHPVFGICFHHALHPIKWPVRILHLLGSFIFGLLVTNMIWLWFLYSEEYDEDALILSISVNGDVVNVTNLPAVEQFTESTQLELTQGMALLWTVGSASHALFDNCIWYLTACICCLPGQSLENLAKYKKYGIGMVVFTVICVAAVATFVVVLRAAFDNSDDAANQLKDLENTGLYNGGYDTLREIEDKSDFNFLISYCVELALALFVYYPIVATVLFSGMFGCGRIPVLGGRPYEVRVEQAQIREDEAARAEAQRRDEEDRQMSMSRSSRGSHGGGYHHHNHRRGGRRPQHYHESTSVGSSHDDYDYR